MPASQFGWSTILNLLTAIAALSAVILAVASEIRAQKRFKQGNEIQERIAAASIRPLLGVNVTRGFAEIKVTLRNEGLGTADMTEMAFRKGNRQGNSLPSVLDPAIKFQWDSIVRLGKQGAYLRPGKKLVLLFLSIDELKKQGIPDATIDQILESVGSQIKGVDMSIKFQDVLGNAQANFETTLE